MTPTPDPTSDPDPDPVPCAAMVRWDVDGPLATPRPCKRTAIPNSLYCHNTAHQRLATTPLVTLVEGGFCLYGCGPGRRYESSRDPRLNLSLCDACATALAKAIATLRPPRKKRA